MNKERGISWARQALGFEARKIAMDNDADSHISGQYKGVVDFAIDNQGNGYIYGTRLKKRWFYYR